MLVFDTSAFINGWRYHYPPATFPTVWDHLATAMADGRIIAPRMVHNELRAKDDEVFGWAHERAALFVEASAEVQAKIGAIVQLTGATGVRDQADPFVIAEAQVRGYTVVTYEGTNTFTGRRTNRWHEKMPGICERLQVPCVIVPEALGLLGVTI